MPNGYGYGNQRGGGYRSNYQYRQPTAAQQESFFNPIPLEFLQQNLQQHQGQFDVAFAGALAAKEKALQEQVALGDTAYRNELIGGTMEDIDRLAVDKYGGDYGRASKDIARRVTDLRADPFWASSKHLAEQQKLQQKTLLEHPDMHLYKDVSKIGAYDPETKGIRSIEELTFRGRERLPWLKNLNQQVVGLEGDQMANVLSNIGIEGMGGIKTVKELDDDDIRELAYNESFIDSFLENNPDFAESKEEIDKMTPDEIDKAAGDFIYGNLMARKGKKVDLRPFKLPVDAAGAGDGVPEGVVVRNITPSVDINVSQPDVQRRKMDDLTKQVASSTGTAKADAQKELDRRNHEVDFSIRSAQSEGYGIDYGAYWNEYQTIPDADFEKGDMEKIATRDEFVKAVSEAVKSGEKVPKRVGKQGVGQVVAGAPRPKNPFSDAVDAMRDAVTTFNEEVGVASIRGKALAGSGTPSDVRTRVNTYEDVLNKQWQEGKTSFTIPYSGMQVDAYVKENYAGKSKADKNYDPTKSNIIVMDGTMDGQITYQLVLRNAKGITLEQIPIAPQDQSNARTNLIKVADDIHAQGYPAEAQEIKFNLSYGPMVQKSDIYLTTEGDVTGMKFEDLNTGKNRGVRFENRGTYSEPDYRLYYKAEGGNRKYFNTGPAGSIVDEDTMKAALYGIHLGVAQRKAEGVGIQTQ